MTTQGPYYPTACATDGTGEEWLNPDNAKTSNNSYTTVVVAATVSALTSALIVTDFDFGIPAYSTIDGIKVEVERKRKNVAGGNVWDWSCMLTTSGAPAGDEKSAGASWSTTEGFVTFGGAADLWGRIWTWDEVNNDNFGFYLVADMLGGNAGTEIAYVDTVRITVYYTEAVLGAQVITVSS